MMVSSDMPLEQILEERRQAAIKALAEKKAEPQPPPEKDPIDEAAAYVANAWFQQLVPLRTQCFRCRVDSPVVYAPNGTLAFGRPVHRNDRDITDAVVAAFERIEWRFQKRKSYCPSCKGLGSV